MRRFSLSMANPQAKELLKDPSFWSKPENERISVLSSTDPDFKNFSPEDQRRAVKLAEPKYRATAPPPASGLKLEAGGKPGIGQRLKETVLGSPRAGDTAIGRATGHSYEAPSEKHVSGADLPLLRFEAMTPEKGVGSGLAKFATELTTAPNMLLAAGGGLGEEALGAVHNLLPKALGAAFSVQMLGHAAEQYPQLKKDIQEGNYDQAAEDVTKMATETATGLLGLTHHVFKRKAPKVETGDPPSGSAPPPLPSTPPALPKGEAKPPSLPVQPPKSTPVRPPLKAKATAEPPKEGKEGKINGRPVILQEDNQPLAYKDTAPPPEPPKATTPESPKETLSDKSIEKGNQKIRQELTGDAPAPEQATAPPPATPLQKAQSALRGGAVTEMPVSEIQVDPKRFQFKQKAIGKSGTTEELKDVEEFDPEKAGVVSVWEDPKDGKTYVVNGHHRLDLAKRAGYEGNLLVQKLKAKDASEARLKGALINIAEGRGEAMDAAKVFREGKLEAKDLKRYAIAANGTIAKQGMALSKLDPVLFEKASTGELPEGKAAIIGELLDTPAKQDAAVKLLEQADKRGKKLTDSEFREVVRLQVGRASTVKKTEQTLFGDIESEHNVALELGQVSDYIKQQLRSEKSLFGRVGTEGASKRLGETGNVIKAEENKARSEEVAQVQELYERLSKSSGPIAEALDSAAKELADGQSTAEVKSRAYDRIRDTLRTEVSALNGGGKTGVRPGVAGARGERGSQASGGTVETGVPPKEEKGPPAARKDLTVNPDRPENQYKPEAGDLEFKPGEKSDPKKFKEAQKVVGGEMRWGKEEDGKDRIVKIDRVERLPNGNVAWHLTNLEDGSESYTQGPINPKYVSEPKTGEPPKEKFKGESAALKDALTKSQNVKASAGSLPPDNPLFGNKRLGEE